MITFVGEKFFLYLITTFGTLLVIWTDVEVLTYRLGTTGATCLKHKPQEN